MSRFSTKTRSESLMRFGVGNWIFVAIVSLHQITQYHFVSPCVFLIEQPEIVSEMSSRFAGYQSEMYQIQRKININRFHLMGENSTMENGYCLLKNQRSKHLQELTSLSNHGENSLKG